MKTYTKIETKTKNRLEIMHEDNPQSPRDWDNLGYFITCDSRQYSPDRHETLEKIVRTCGNEAKDQNEHIKMIKRFMGEEIEEKVVAIYPINKYEHSGISFSLGTKHSFDHSNNGFYIITNKTQKLLGIPKKSFEKVIRQELEEYNKYLNGEIYCFISYDENGECEDSCGGFWNLEDIKTHLGREWKNENMQDYLID